MGSLTTLAVELRDEPRATAAAARGQKQAWEHAVQQAKDILIHSSARSSSTYVLGYDAAPFEAEEDGGFRATLSMVPAYMEGMACWDTYQKGSCSRRASCSYCHPSDDDLAPVRVILAKSQELAARGTGVARR